MTVECFAQRLLNPFRGAMHTIRYASAEAATLDGVHWDIYVANEQLLEDLEVSRWTQISDIRYGKWTLENGLTRGPIYPSDDFKRMEEMGAMVYEHLTRVYNRVPFPFRDHYELWLLDTNSQPLALIESAISEKAMTIDPDIEWRAGFTAKERFASIAIESLGQELTQSLSAAEYLTRYINDRAGPELSAQWFKRNPDGSGTGLQGIGPNAGYQGQTLIAGAFPALLLSTKGHDEVHMKLIEDFHTWQAPWLLTLPNLGRELRRNLEHRAREQATMVHDQYRLYPETVDETAIKASIVESIMRRSQPSQENAKENTLPTYYIELNPSPSE